MKEPQTLLVIPQPLLWVMLRRVALVLCGLAGGVTYAQMQEFHAAFCEVQK